MAISKDEEFQTRDKPACSVTSADIDRAEKQDREQEKSAESGMEDGGAVWDRAPASIGTGGFGKVEQHSGLYSYRIPVHTPAPQNGGPVPGVAFTYYSRATSAASLAAAGWYLELGSIQRKAAPGRRVNFKNDQGKENSNDFFILQLNGRTYTLVRVYGEENKHRFRAKKEGTFIEAERFLKGDCIDPDSGEPEIDYWKVYTANGVTYFFGVEGVAGEKQVPGQVRNKVWHLCGIEDAYGRKAVYEYEFEASSHPDEIQYSYPARIKYGMTRDRGSRDTEVVFVYRKDDAPNPGGIYYDLEEKENYTGRDMLCFLKRRLAGVHTRVRTQNGQMALTRKLLIDASICQYGVFRVEGIREEPYKDGNLDKTALIPPHRFTYIDEGPGHPALMVTSREPLGRVMEMHYAKANQIDKGQPVAVRNLWLVRGSVERIGDGAWTHEHDYWDSTYFTPYDEYRGHSRVDTWNRETGMHSSTWYEQNGVHNGFVKKEIQYDGRGDKKISQRENCWVALDYKGGRHLPLISKSVEYRYGEDGETVLSTVVKEVPKFENERQETPWEYAVDEYGNILRQIETVYEGDLQGKVILRKKTVTRYRNIAAGEHRYIGLPLETRVYSLSDPTGPEQLKEWVKKEYNDKGQVTGTLTYYSQENEAVYRTTVEYHPVTGKETKKFRYNGREKMLVEETRYYEEGPYRFLPHQVFNALGQAKELKEYDLSVREATVETGIDGMVTQRRFDGRGRKTEEIFCGHSGSPDRRGDKDSVRYVYTVSGEERSIETLHLHTGARTKEYFDPLKRKYKVEKTGYKGRIVVEAQTEFDHRSRQPARVFEPYYADESPAGFKTIEYDDYRLRKTREIYPGGDVMRYRYDGFTETVFEDVHGRDAAGQVGDRVYTRVKEEKTVDAAGRIVSRADALPGDELRYELNYVYDSRERLVKVTDNQGAVLWTLDYGNRIDDKPVSIVDISSGMKEQVYDGLGRVIETRGDFKARGDRLSSIAYDALDRIVQQVDRDTGDDAGCVLRNEYDTAPHGIGQLARRSVTHKSQTGITSHSLNRTYDSFGYLKSVIHGFDVNRPDIGVELSLNVQVEYEHNGLKGGRPERISCREIEGMPGAASEYIYEYDDVSGMVTAIRLNGKTAWEITGAGVTARGNVKGTRLGNGICTQYDYEPKTGWLKELKVLRHTDVLLDDLLTYDTAGNVRERTLESVFTGENGVENPVASQALYQYNRKNQLVEAAEDGNRQRFTYKPNGSRVSFTEGGNETRYAYEDDHPHRLSRLSGAREREFSYDGAGNLVKDIDRVSGNVRRFSWNPTDKPRAVEFFNTRQDRVRRIDYGYSGDGQPAIMADSLGKRVIFYAGDTFAFEWTGSGKKVFHTHVMNRQRRVLTLEQEVGAKPSQRCYYYHRDRLYSVVLLTDEEGNVIGSTGYEAFGNVSRESGEHRSGILFTGHRADVVNYEGFTHYDFKARLYDPTTGIFLSPDKVEDVKNAAFGLNRYIYVDNNPTSKYDPRGTEVTWYNPLSWVGGLMDLAGQGMNLLGRGLEYVPIVGGAAGKAFQTAGNFARTAGNLMTFEAGEAGTRAVNFLQSMGSTFTSALEMPTSAIGMATLPFWMLRNWQLPSFNYTTLDGIWGEEKRMLTATFDSLSIPGIIDAGGMSFGHFGLLEPGADTTMTSSGLTTVLEHETGHSVLSTLWGPLYLPITLFNYLVEGRSSTAAVEQQADLFGQRTNPR